ncbi:endonuclease/exonuclease/phosphatase family protein [Sphingobacterium oryzagri]|uniref:Endonuclease/exonuclease/phosphatase family protein n=1 Tax=Sphingobacterium oryzagri TaxID=3025669 RepID=A0ABY7WDC4_9SPHI|nr:endonuclease/exonuclease/phosphatase family protein [Sphingobacterium sp. KACC 22765]WDF67475.1 endonuclease/exonuclease/phosphatase family protein [Sphingobacterium sp. KACC 22765]
MIKHLIKSQILALLLSSFSLGIADLQAQDLKVGSYNIRYDNDGDRQNGNGWPSRLPVISSIIGQVDFDVFGAQEVLHHQLLQLDSLIGDDYAHVGIGRDDGKTKGEYAPIFYKKSKFTALENGVFWLSTTPEKPSTGWDAALPRICTWLHLEDKASKKRFWYFNLHMDHVGTKAREESCKLVLKKIQQMLKADEIAVLTGDFNVDQENPMYEILAGSVLLEDSYSAAAFRYAWNGTFNAFDANLFTKSRIDHVFVTKNVTVKKYAVLTDSYRSPKTIDKDIKKGDFPKELSFKDYMVRLPSDHFPVVVDLYLH